MHLTGALPLEVHASRHCVRGTHTTRLGTCWPDPVLDGPAPLRRARLSPGATGAEMKGRGKGAV